MPPVVEPIPYRVLLDLESALALPDAGSSYYYDFNVVKLGTTIGALSELPDKSVMIGKLGGLGRYLEEKSGGALMHSDYHWSVEIVGVPPYSSNEAEMTLNLYRMVADIHRAVMTDHTRGGNAANTTIVEFALAAAEGDQRPWVSCTLDVQLRTQYNDMTRI